MSKNKNLIEEEGGTPASFFRQLPIWLPVVQQKKKKKCCKKFKKGKRCKHCPNG